MIEVPEPPRLTTSRFLLFAIIAVTAGLALSASVLFQQPGLLGQEKDLVDFDAFYIAGQMAERGQAVETYKSTEMMAAQHEFSGTPDFMPWTYLPPYLLIVQLLAQLPIGFSFLAFFAVTFGFYLAVARRIAGAYLPGVLIAILPTMLTLARTGQNGFLTAALIGAFLLAFTERRVIAGVPLGLMVIKPHLAAAVALLLALDRRWGTIALAGGIVAASLVAATTAYGMAIWPAFFGGLRDAGEFLAAAYYPLYRMSSVYAAVLSIGGSPGVALSVHLAGALCAIGVLVLAYVKRWQPRVLAAIACVASVFVSPYNYDYDLAIMGIALAFVLPDILAKARRAEIVALTALSWAATGYGLAASSVIYGASAVGVLTPAAEDHLPSLSAPLLILLVAASLGILSRPSVGRISGQSFAVAG